MRLLLVLLAMVCACALAQAQTAQRVAVGSSLTIQVSDRDATAASLVRQAEALGGYFSVVSNEALTLKVPTDKAAELIAYAKSNWKPVEESYRSEEVVGAMDQLRARLKAKQELLDRFEKLLATADARDIVEVEAAATRLIHEIEVLKGQLQALQHRLDYATVVLNFRLLERQRPRDEGRSPFAWLNGLGLDALLGEFEQ
jgi:hypothetical protein